MQIKYIFICNWWAMFVKSYTTNIIQQAHTPASWMHMWFESHSCLYLRKATYCINYKMWCQDSFLYSGILIFLQRILTIFPLTARKIKLHLSYLLSLSQNLKLQRNDYKLAEVIYKILSTPVFSHVQLNDFTNEVKKVKGHKQKN